MAPGLAGGVLSPVATAPASVTARKRSSGREFGVQPPRKAAGRASALQPTAVDLLPTAAAAASTASLLTALWLRRTWGSASQDAAESEAEEQQAEAAGPVEEAPATVEGIWAAAWEGFAQPPAGTKSAAAGNSPVQGAPADAEQPGRQAAAAAGVDDEAGSPSDEPRSPLLLLQGIRAAERSRLLALCLAATEAQLAALPGGIGVLPGGQWRQVTAALLALACVAAAAAWLGYVPEQLINAAAAQLKAVDGAVLQAAGLQGAAATLQQQAAAVAAAAAAAAPPDDELESSDTAASGVGGDAEAVEWYCLEEKLQLYSSVLRLLSCSTIQQQHQGGPGRQAASGAAASGPVLPGTGEAGAAEAASDSIGEGSAGMLAASKDGSVARRLAAQQLHLQQQVQGVSLEAIRGWRATAGGARSDSALLALAPVVLQDLAVTAADAVAAAYLADAATAGPALAAVSPGAAAGPQRQRSAAEEPQEGLRQRQRGLAAWVPALRQRGSARGTPSSALAAPSSRGGGGGGGGTSSGRPLEAGLWPTFLHPQLRSTRQLQRFANRVAAGRWVERHYHGVADIYEDRLRLWAISQGGRRLQRRAAALKRTPELGRLRGLRYAASLFLEAVDLLAPVLRTLWSRAAAAASWLVVRLVGQAVALVRRGVQMSSSRGAEPPHAGAPRRTPAREGRRRQRNGGGGQDGAAPLGGLAWQP